MTFRVTVLGTGSALPVGGKHHSAHALNVHEQFYLVDCGEGTQYRLVECGINPMKINAVFISHLHGDHIFGLFPLLSSLSLMGRKTPLRLYGPHPLAALVATLTESYNTKLPYEVLCSEVSHTMSQAVFENKVMEVLTIPLRHRTPSVGYLFREKQPSLNVRKDAIAYHGLTLAEIVAAKRGEDIGRVSGTIPNARITYRPYFPRAYAYCSDTMYSGKVASLVRDVDLLYHEATFAEEDKLLARETGHSTAAQAAKVAATAGVGRLLIGHFSGRYKDGSLLVEQASHLFPGTEEAVEGRAYDVPLCRTRS